MRSLLLQLFFIIIPVFVFQAVATPFLLMPDSTGSCSGSLGENIFSDGDFGSGFPNIVSVDPGTAPDYIYTTNTPPGDGFFTITNNSGNWPNIWGSWLQIRDNSNDPNGYFMVVNASFQPGLFYTQEVDGLCPETEYVFGADVINMIRSGVANHIRPNLTFELDGQVFLTTGDIVQDEIWHTYDFTFSTLPGQTSVTLSIRNNAPGGIGNDIGLDNISFRACGPRVEILPADTSYVCVQPGAPPLTLNSVVPGNTFSFFQWQVSGDQGLSWTELPNGQQGSYTISDFATGTYLYRFLLASSFANLDNIKCRLISPSKPLVSVPIFYESADTICEGSSLTIGNSVYTQAGVYVDSLISSIGCDSIITRTVVSLPQPSPAIPLEAVPPSCWGDADAQIVVSANPGGIPPFQYSLDGGMFGTASLFTGLTAGNYQVEATDRYGCRFEAQVLIENPPPLTLEVPADTTLIFGQLLPARLTASNTDVSFVVSPDTALSCNTCPEFVIRPARTTAYQVLATTASGCAVSDSFVVSVEGSQFELYIPTAFTPNGDGINELFEIITEYPGAIIQLEQFSVFNRWGNVVHESTEIQAGNPTILSWDGSALPEGVYLYVLRLLMLDQRVQVYSGSITILR